MKPLTLDGFPLSFKNPVHYPFILFEVGEKLFLGTMMVLVVAFWLWTAFVAVLIPVSLVVDLIGTTGSYYWHNHLTNDPSWYQFMSWSDHWDWYHKGPDAVPMAWREGQ